MSQNLKPKSLLILLLLFIALTACKTTYAPTNFTGGYSVIPIDKFTYRITINANRFTQINEAEEMALLKASELTLKTGYRRFLITHNTIRNKSVASATPSYLKLFVAAMPSSARPTGEIQISILAPDNKDFERGLEAIPIYTRLKPKLDGSGPKF